MQDIQQTSQVSKEQKKIKDEKREFYKCRQVGQQEGAQIMKHAELARGLFEIFFTTIFLKPKFQNENY